MHTVANYNYPQPHQHHQHHHHHIHAPPHQQHLPPAQIPPPPPPPQAQPQQQHMQAGNNYSHYGHATPPPSGRYRFALQVAQQPIRARMCGFGDKDRRQITPPPCVRLRIFDTVSGMEVRDVSQMDVSCFALCVELWSADEAQNMSLVLPTGQIHHPEYHHNRPNGNNGMMQSQAVTPTKNLIGSLVATAFKLHDLEEEQGVWFVLQDLSVRTEGQYKLKFSFVNLADSFNGSSTAPILCSAYSQPFKSYSAKKFPGVIDSTELSRCFAVQGVKIPIRRDHKTRNKNNSYEKNQNNH